MIYFDTDVIIHSIIIQDQEKHIRSVDLTKKAIENDEFFITFLVSHETAFVLSRLGFSQEFINNNVSSFLSFACFDNSRDIFLRACDLAYRIGFSSINDCVHTAMAEQFCEELKTYNKKDFKKIEPYTSLKISLLN